jgi:hypothetical protein
VFGHPEVWTQRQRAGTPLGGALEELDSIETLREGDTEHVFLPRALATKFQFSLPALLGSKTAKRIFHRRCELKFENIKRKKVLTG